MGRNSSSAIALGGVMAALAVVILCLGGMIPASTFVCPMLCMMILSLVLGRCGARIAWAWYGAVAILGLLLGPDKEAAAVFLFLGYYPILKPWLDRQKFRWLYKTALFNASILVMYALLLKVFGMEELAREYEEAGMVMTAVMLLLGNVTFFMLDRLLGRKIGRR